MTKIIIFDFDGTLADTFETMLAITNCLAEEFGYESVSQEDIAKVQHLSSWQIVRQSGISFFQMPFLMRRVRAELKNRIGEIDIFNGIKEVILGLQEGGYRLGIITSNSEDNVRFVMEKNGLGSSFDFVCSGLRIFGKHRLINNLLAREKLKPEEVVYVGDETRDIDAARKSRIKAIAVSWGFNSPEALIRHNPDYLIRHPQELIEVIKNWE